MAKHHSSMKTETLIPCLALAAALCGASVQASPNHSVPAKDQSPALKVQEIQVAPSRTNSTTAVETERSQEPRAAAPTTLQPESPIIQETRVYETSLRDLAQKAEQIVQQMPDKPD